MRTDEGAALAERTMRENPRPEGEAREFPGCRPVTMTREEIEAREGRIEGRVALLETLVRRTLASQGQPGSGPRLDARDLDRVTGGEVVDARLRSKDEPDFRARLRTLRRRRG